MPNLIRGGQWVWCAKGSLKEIHAVAHSLCREMHPRMRATRLIYYAEGAFVLVILTRLNVLFHGLRAFIEADEIFRVVRFQEIAGRHRAALRVLCPEE